MDKMREEFEENFPVPSFCAWDDDIGDYISIEPTHSAVSMTNNYKKCFNVWCTALQSQPAIDSGAEPVAWLVTGGRVFKDRAFISEIGANNSVSDRGDDANVVPLYTHPAPTAQDSKVPEAWIELLQGIVNELSIMDDSQGVAGLHLNGEISSWDEGDLPYLRDRAASMLSAAYSIAKTPDHTEQPLAMVAEQQNEGN